MSLKTKPFLKRLMGDISLIEWIAYGSICYGSLILLASLVTKPEVPASRSYASQRMLYMIPGLICAGVLSFSGVTIGMPGSTTTEIVKNINGTIVTTSSTVQASSFTLLNPAWITIHILFFFVFFIYIFSQVLFIFTKHD